VLPNARLAGASRLTVTVMKRGPWFKADIMRLANEAGVSILKDFSEKGRLMRWFGARQLQRERRALRRLAGLPGIPVDLGEVPPCGLLLEPMAGEAITRWRRRTREEIEPMVERLSRLVDAMHARGVAHLDLRKRDNVLVAADGALSVIDFNASVCFAPGSIGARLFFPALRRIDRDAVLKWKSFLLPDLLTPEERRRQRRMGRWRRFWVFS
jgi:hypothetical protein